MPTEPRQWRADAELAKDACERLVANAFRKEGARSFGSIPADPERDADLILGRIVDAFPRLLDALEAAQLSDQNGRDAIFVLAKEIGDERDENKRLKRDLKRAQAVVEAARKPCVQCRTHLPDCPTGQALAAYDAHDAPAEEARP